MDCYLNDAIKNICLDVLNICSNRENDIQVVVSAIV